MFGLGIQSDYLYFLAEHELDELGEGRPQLGHHVHGLAQDGGGGGARLKEKELINIWWEIDFFF